MLMLVVMGITGACAPTKIGLNDLDPTVALLKAASAVVLTADAYAVAYKAAMNAADVKDDTVIQAIDAYRAARLGGLGGQLEKALDTIQIIVESDVAGKIQKRATDLGRSWEAVEPLFLQAYLYAQVADELQTFATLQTTIGSTYEIWRLREIFKSDRDATTTIAGAVLGVKFVLQMAEILPKLISNYENLDGLGDQLAEIPNYDDERNEMERAAGKLNDLQRQKLEDALGKTTADNEPVFPTLFSEETTLQADVSTKSSDRSASDFDGKLKDAGYCVRVQRALKDRKFYTGQIDGLCGRRSRKAVQAFNLSEGLGGSSTWTRDAEARLFKN